MGSSPKAVCFILFDYVIILIFGAIYYCIVTYATIHSQCIPGNKEGSNPSDCGLIISNYTTFNTTTPFLAYPYESKPIPVTYPYILGAATWFAVLLLSILMIHPPLSMLKQIFIKMEALWREVLLAIIITQMGVGAIKTYVGRPRPNWWTYQYIDAKDSISSFPSGHASSSFCIHILLVYHVLASIYWSYRSDKKISGVDNMHSLFGAKLWQKTRDCSSFNVMIVMALLIIPIWISCTRITDYYHNYSDVIGGAALGILVSTIVFSVFHNELYPHHQFCDKSVREPLLSNMSDA